MPLKINNREWKEFFIKDIFLTEKNQKQVPTGAYIHKDYLTIGNMPRVTVTSQNNGVDAYYNSLHKNYRIIENFISTSFLGSVFYHPYSASLDMKVHSLQFKQVSLNRYNGIFIVSELKKSLENASYGNQISSTDLPIKKILLPTDEQDKPDYNYIEQYAKSIFDKKLNKYIKYAKSILDSLETKEILKLQEKEWKEFFLIDVFPDIQRGKRLTKANQIEGNKPYISSTASNNGVDNFISNSQNVRVFSNCLSIANSGSVGASFYHPYEFIASDHITYLKNENMNKFTYLFISTLTNRFSQKYNFNREINDKRISKEKILLPINEIGEPDYQYMEQYMKNLEYRKIKQYLDYLK